MSFAVVVDSCCDLTPAMRADTRFRSIPLTIHVGGEDFVDNENLDTSLLIVAMDQCESGSSTSCPSPGDYLSAYEAAEGDIYVVTLSALLSGSYNSAWQARQMFLEENPDRNIHIFNSCSASSGEVMIALKIRELADSGLPFVDVVTQVEEYTAQMQTLFVLENLDNLRKNGRLTKVQAALTGALKIKLLMGATPEGEICKHGQALSIKQALSKMVDMMKVDAKHLGKTLCIAQCLCPDRAEYLKGLVEKHCAFSNVIIVATRGLSSFYANNGGIIAAY